MTTLKKLVARLAALCSAVLVVFGCRHREQKPQLDPRLYREPCCKVEVVRDVVYGSGEGYWASLPGSEHEVATVFKQGFLKSFKKRNVDLTMDIYVPTGPDDKEGATGPEELRPVIVFIHGGAFYIGDKEMPMYLDFCRYFASLGYVTASINYRMGFHLREKDIERAGNTAVDDADKAVRYLLSHGEDYGIDPDRIYLAGSSAGSITAMTLAYSRKHPSYNVRALANMWGAMEDVSVLKNSKTEIISFHGDADKMVPYGHDYPFTVVGDFLAGHLSEKMYGSSAIDSAARRYGIKSEMHTFPGEGHAFNTDDDGRLNSKHYQIRDSIRTFFYENLYATKN